MNSRYYFSQILLIFFLTVMIMTGCSRGEEKNINLVNLLIGQNDMPPHWPTSEFSEVGIDKDRSRDSVAISFNSDLHPDAYSSMQNVYRFHLISEAELDFKEEVNYYKRYYLIPSQWAYSSNIPSDSAVFCKEEKYPICVWIARYKNIVVDLQVPIIPGRMSMNNFENLVREIDMRARKQIMNIP